MGQDECCSAVRRFLSKRIGEVLAIDERPDLKVRNAPAIEEVWRSRSHAFVVEHTRVEAFESQIEDDAAFERLVRSIEVHLAGALPGRFSAALPFGAASKARGSVDAARAEIVNLIMANAGTLRDDETIELQCPQLPYRVRLHKRHSNDNRIFFARWIENGNDAASNRAERIGRALDQKLPKLDAASKAYGAKSVLVLESKDVALSNIFNVATAFKEAMNRRLMAPEMVFLIESDTWPLCGWFLKEGDALLPREEAFEDDGGPD